MIRDEENPLIEYKYMFYPSPSEAAGTYDGFPFYFYARFDYCTFTLVRTEGVDPISIFDMGNYDLAKAAFSPAHLEAWNECFHVEMAFEPRAYEGSYLDDESKKRLIREFCVRFDVNGRQPHKELLRRKHND